MTLNAMKTKRWIGLVAAALSVLLVVPSMLADEERPQRLKRDRDRLEQPADGKAQGQAARQRAREVHRAQEEGRPGVGGFRNSPEGASERRRIGQQDGSIISGVVVTDTNPDQIKSNQVALRPYWHGPFDGPDTLNLFVVTLFDESKLDGPFDLVVRFYLPEGPLYEERVVPVDPEAGVAEEIHRPDLAPHPVEVHRTVPAGAVTRSMAVPEDVQVPEEPSYVNTVLPVTGTWITKRALYGTWTVQAIIRQNGKEIEMEETTFDIHL